MAKTPCSQGRGPGFDPWLGNYIPCATVKVRDPVCCNITKTQHSQYAC